MGTLRSEPGSARARGALKSILGSQTGQTTAGQLG